MTTPNSVGIHRMDVFEDPVTNMVTATFELPGVSRDKITIDVFNNRLTISGEVASYFDANYGYILRERRTGPFARTLGLPEGIPVSHFKRLLASSRGLIDRHRPWLFDCRSSLSELPWKTGC